MDDSRYEVRRRRWPFRRPLARPWELIRRSDMKPVGFYRTPVEATEAKLAVELVESWQDPIESRKTQTRQA